MGSGTQRGVGNLRPGGPKARGGGGAAATASLEPLVELMRDLPETRLRHVFTHASWVTDRTQSYERLAFLGDAVLSLSLSDNLMRRFRRRTAGSLTKLRAQIVSRRSCAEVGIALGVPRMLMDHAPDTDREALERLVETPSALAEAVEAVIGACFVEFGFERTRLAVVKAFAAQTEFAIAHRVDFKSALQERLARGNDGDVTYRVTGETGPPHDRRFETAAVIGGEVLGHGFGRTKKEAEQEAARQALDVLEGRGGKPQ